jgi:hypothetical protein
MTNYRTFVSLEQLVSYVLSSNWRSDKLEIRAMLLNDVDDQVIKLYLFENGIEVVNSSKVSVLFDWIKEQYGVKWMIDNKLMEDTNGKV